jgi:peroxiredoxin
VVLYFFPAAYTSGCTAEAHEFAEATPEFEKLGATVIGVTAGNVDRIKDFSKEHCRDKFAVAAANADLVKTYDVVLSQKPEWSNRTSYVITPDHKIAAGLYGRQLRRPRHPDDGRGEAVFGQGRQDRFREEVANLFGFQPAARLEGRARWRP